MIKAGLLNRLHALAIHDRRAWVGMAAHTFAFGAMHSRVEQMPCASQTETPEVIEDRLPRREVARQVAPGAATAYDIEDGVENAPQRDVCEVCHIVAMEGDTAERRPIPRQSGC